MSTVGNRKDVDGHVSLWVPEETGSLGPLLRRTEARLHGCFKIHSMHFTKQSPFPVFTDRPGHRNTLSAQLRILRLYQTFSIDARTCSVFATSCSVFAKVGGGILNIACFLSIPQSQGGC